VVAAYGQSDTASLDKPVFAIQVDPVALIDAGANLNVSMGVGSAYAVGVTYGYKESRLTPMYPFLGERLLEGQVAGVYVGYWFVDRISVFHRMLFGPHLQVGVLTNSESSEVGLQGGFRFPIVDFEATLLPFVDLSVGCRAISARSISPIAIVSSGFVF
jgi:hypothetical protein